MANDQIMIKSTILDLAWAEKRWIDPISGTEMVCISPPQKKHYRNNYFRFNMMTWDGRYAVFCEFTEIPKGLAGGEVHLIVRDMISGGIRDLGSIPLSKDNIFDPELGWAVARYSHLVNVIDASNPEASAIIQINLENGERRRIELSEKLDYIYDPNFDATERYIYTPWWKEKGHLRSTMMNIDFWDYLAMFAAQPGYQEMVRIDLKTGKVEPVFNTSTWWMGHPNPHPHFADLFMCCQEWYGENPKSKWGECSEHQRVRIIDLATQKWLHEIPTNLPWPRWGMGYHEHWASWSKTAYSHAGKDGYHQINKIDLLNGTFTTYTCPLDTGLSAHVMIAPNEKFLVGDGVELDKNMSLDLRQRVENMDEKLLTESRGAKEAQRLYLNATNGGETIWLYHLPDENRPFEVTKLCQRRTLFRTKMFGYRLECDAHVSPDNNWAIFQSASEDDWFEVWAARVPTR